MGNPLNIYQRMAAITADLQTVGKNLTVSAGKTSYKAVSERDIIDAVKPIEAKHGVYSYPSDREILESATLESESEYGGKVLKKTTFFSRIKTVYRFVNIDEPTDFIETVTFAEGIDPQDKGSGKAMTYADKYALMKAYKISTGDDPDQTASVETEYKKISRESFARAKEKEAAGLYTPTCVECGVEITDAEHDYSAWKFGRPLCRSCQKRVKNADN